MRNNYFFAHAIAALTAVTRANETYPVARVHTRAHTGTHVFHDKSLFRTICAINNPINSQMIPDARMIYLCMRKWSHLTFPYGEKGTTMLPTKFEIRIENAQRLCEARLIVDCGDGVRSLISAAINRFLSLKRESYRVTHSIGTRGTFHTAEIFCIFALVPAY